MRYADCNIVWNDAEDAKALGKEGPGVLVVLRKRDPGGDEYSSSIGGCCYPECAMEGVDLELQVLEEAFMLMVQEGIDPQEVHREFCKIDEYRMAVPLPVVVHGETEEEWVHRRQRISERAERVRKKMPRST